MRHIIAGTTLCLLLAVAPALADCTTIAAAMTAVERTAGVRQILHASPADGGAVIGETLKFPDALYMRQGAAAKWVRLPLDATKRLETAEKMMKAMPISDCAGPRNVAEAGVAYRAFDYAQPNPLKGGAKSRSSIWLDGDGRIARLVLEDGSRQIFEYGVKDAPAVEPPRPGKTK